MIPTFKFGGNSANWAWYQTQGVSWVADVLGSTHTKVDGEYVADPRYRIKVWKTTDAQGHYNHDHPDYEFVYRPKNIPASKDKLTEQTLNKVIRAHVQAAEGEK